MQTDRRNHYNTLTKAESYGLQPKDVISATHITNNYVLPSSAMVKESQSKVFIPFINERDKMNRLIPLTTRIDTRSGLLKGTESTRNIMSSNYKIIPEYALQVSRKNKRNLKNILDLDFEHLHTSTSVRVKDPFSGTSPIRKDGDSNSALLNFKVKWPASQRFQANNLTRTASNVHLTESSTEEKEGLSPLNVEKGQSPSSKRTHRPARFKTLSASRNLSITQSASLFDPKSFEVVKPRIKNVIISKTKLQRDRPLEKTQDHFLTASYTNESSTKSIIDFSKQTSRANRDIGRSARHITHPVEREIVNGSNVDDIERAFQFSQQLKQKYNNKKKIAPTFKICNQSIPYDAKKMNEMTNNLMRLYKVVQNSIAKPVYS